MSARPPEWVVMLWVAVFGLIVWGVGAAFGVGGTVLFAELFLIALWVVREIALWVAAIHYRLAWERLRRHEFSEESE